MDSTTPRLHDHTGYALMMEGFLADRDRRRTVWYCADQRDGRRVHVDSRGNLVNGPSRIVHSGGRLACDDGRVAD